jgi:hypothetical protein
MDGKKIEQSRLAEAFEGVALDALTPLLEASDCGHTILPPGVWNRVLDRTKQKIAEAYFRSHAQLKDLEATDA